MFNAARKDVKTSSVRTLKISHPNNRDNDSIILKIDDDTGQVAVTDTSHRGVSTGFIPKDRLVNVIVKHYYVRKNGFSPYDYEQAIRMFDFLGKPTLSEQAIRYGSISMCYEKVDGMIKIDGVPGFCETHKVNMKHFNDFNDTTEVDKAFKVLKNDVFEDANNRKIQLKLVLEAVEKLAHDAGFQLDTEGMDAFERVAFFDCKAGEDDPEIMDMFDVEKRYEHKKKGITFNEAICYLLIVLCVAVIFCGMLAPIISGR